MYHMSLAYHLYYFSLTYFDDISSIQKSCKSRKYLFSLFKESPIVCISLHLFMTCLCSISLSTHTHARSHTCSYIFLTSWEYVVDITPFCPEYISIFLNKAIFFTWSRAMSSFRKFSVNTLLLSKSQSLVKFHDYLNNVCHGISLTQSKIQ